MVEPRRPGATSSRNVAGRVLGMLLLLSGQVSWGEDTYFPPPESQGGWRMLQNAEEIRARTGMDPAKLDELRDWLLKSDNRDFAAVVIRRGQVVLQVERGNSATTDARRLASVSKAICATVLSIASERSQQGLTPRKMTFEDRAFDFIPWAQPLSDPRKTQITVKQLLNHTSGLCPEALGAKNEGSWQYVLGHTGDPKTANLAFDPGTACGYSTLAFHHASLVCETVTGKPYDKFAIEALLKPIGCEHWWFESFEGDAAHGKHPSHSIGLPARDLARIGYCMMRNGRWNDQQVIPGWFVDQTANPTQNVKTREMRFKLNPQVFSHGWQIPALLGDDGERNGKGIPRDARYKPGSGGQLIAFVPSLDLVIARQTGSSGSWPYEEYLRRACAAARSRDLPAFPKVSDLPSHKELPDPLVMLDGRRVTTPEQWVKERRPELIALFQHYMYGTLPPRPGSVTGQIERTDPSALGGTATLKEVTLSFGSPTIPPIYLMLVVPNQRQGPAPVVLDLNYFGNHTLVRDPKVRLSTAWMPERGEGVVNHRSTDASRGTWADIWRIEDIIKRGYALATFYMGDVDPDDIKERGLQKFVPQDDPADDCGTIGAWAWGLQRAVDYLVTTPDIDQQRIVVTGHSRTGKAALVAAAFDERIAMALPHQAGTGGSAPSRTDVRDWHIVEHPEKLTWSPKAPETVAKINGKFPHWFNPRFKEFNDHPEKLPIDQHCLVALCAPRPVLFTNGRTDTWINPAGQFEVLRAAAPVYRLLGAGDFTATEIPPDGTMIDGTLGYFIRPGGHLLKPEDWKAFLDYADNHLVVAGNPAANARANTATQEAALVETPRWELHEFELHGKSTADNPFRDAALKGEFTSPSGKATSVDGFYDGGDTWRLRFAPDEEGEWRYKLRGEGVEVAQAGRMKCLASRGHGFIRIHPDNPYAFAYADGTAFFPMGDTCYGLYDDTPITPELRRQYLETRRSQHFNFVRMSVGHSKARAAADPAYWAWGGTSEKPDLDRFNPVFFRGLDALFCEMQAQGMNIELILLNYYRPPFTDTKRWTPERERLWLRYVLARYGAFNNVFLLTLANEYETHPDGRYRLDPEGDVAWARNTAQLVKQFDPFHHPVTVHPVISSSVRGVSPREPFDRPWRIGGFYGEGREIDVLSQQTGQNGEGTTWDEALQCWTGDSVDLVASVKEDRRFNKPVLNTENGYEYLRGDPTSKNQVHHTDKVRRSSWRIVCAGAYFAAGFHGTIGHSDAWNRIDASHHYTFTLRDEGATGQLRILYDFFAQLPFWKMQPFAGVEGDAVALAEPGKNYVVYFPHGGQVMVDLGAARGALTARWLNPRTGESIASGEVRAGAEKLPFTPPFAGDAVLRLESSPSSP